MFQIQESGSPVIQGTMNGDSIELLVRHFTSERRPVQRSLNYEKAVELRDKLSLMVDELGDRLDQQERERGAA